MNHGLMWHGEQVSEGICYESWINVAWGTGVRRVCHGPWINLAWGTGVRGICHGLTALSDC